MSTDHVSADPPAALTSGRVDGAREGSRRVRLPPFALRRRIAALVAMAVLGAVVLVSVAAWLVI
ncbi:MAG TPA: hypothetical protein VHC41_09835, partial [Mycobacteriales bacterium]|nr:hypothetical protein [Mycobacteriales bacterium]